MTQDANAVEKAQLRPKERRAQDEFLRDQRDKQQRQQEKVDPPPPYERVPRGNQGGNKTAGNK
jgi:hypothetical protein